MKLNNLMSGLLAAIALAGCGTPQTPEVTQYSISMTVAVGGTIAATVDGVEVTQAPAGTEITIAAAEDNGYKFARWAIMGATPADVTTKTTTFTMPASNVTVTAGFINKIQDEGVVINGVKWATRNVDRPGTFADTPLDAGLFYQWGRKTGWSKEPLRAYDEDGEIAEATWDYTYEDDDFWSEENDPSPEGWRVPTLQEIAMFDPEMGFVTLERVGEYTGEDGYTYAAGYKITDIATGASMFLPGDGYLNAGGGSWGNTPSYGVYWTATKSDNDYEAACSLNFYNTGDFAPARGYHRGNAFLLRPVKM
jgi:hypothetical protein